MIVNNPPLLSAPDFFLIDSAQYYQISSAMEQLAQRQQMLVLQLQSMRKLLAEVREVQTCIADPKRQQTAGKGRTENDRQGEQKKHFKKNRICMVIGCAKKYSSRISLRAHIRKCHGEEWLQKQKKAYRH